MAIAVMRKLRLAAVSYDKDSIFNALQSTGAVEIKFLEVRENTFRPESEAERIFARLEEAELAVEELGVTCARYAKEHKLPFDSCKDGFFVCYDEFMAAHAREEEADALITQIYALARERARLSAELQRVNREIGNAQPYRELDIPFNSLRDTPKVKIYYGVALNGAPLFHGLAAVETAGYGERTAVMAAVHKSACGEVEELLRGASFTPCPYLSDARTGQTLYGDLLDERARLEGEIAENDEREFALAGELRFLKIYSDRLRFEHEKAQLSDKILTTERTTLLEAYVPAGQEDEVRRALGGLGESIYCDFVDLEEGEMPPTLMKNNEVVKNFEAITNLYSPPNAKEFDPSAIMGFFYSLFLGFIMGDVGYGIFMIAGGGYLWWRDRAKDNGLKRLAAVFCIGGIFTVIWGFLFNSFFGIGLLPVRVMPPLLGDNTNWTFVGIKIPALLLIAMELGVFQLIAGYLCRAIQAWRRGHVLDGIFDGLSWTVFSVGLFLAIIGLVKEANLPILMYVGGGMAGGGLLLAVLTAGRKEKFFGKFTKGFGAAYGVINYVSDILSYARLYGLMLSGAVIAEIVSGYALVGYNGSEGMIMSGNAGLIILGVVLLVLGHVLNLALSLLGAYIHDARLQYVEFYGRFYEGEGELFAPIGSSHQHVFIASGERASSGGGEIKSPS